VDVFDSCTGVPCHPYRRSDAHDAAPGKPPIQFREVPNSSVAAYSPLPWHDFFVGTIGASAALTGLLFVAISINLEEILKYPQLPGRALGTLGILVSALVVSGFGLAPAQSNHVLGIEIAITGALVAVQPVWATYRQRVPDGPKSWMVEHLVTLLVSSIAFIIGGVSLAVGEGGGLYWVLAGILFAFVSGSLNGWVLLVEIKR
jgi:hypothetical protein